MQLNIADLQGRRYFSQLGAKQEVATFDETAPTQSKGVQLSFWQVPGKYFDRLPSTETLFSNFL
jgi:hypothetical protein